MFHMIVYQAAKSPSDAFSDFFLGQALLEALSHENGCSPRQLIVLRRGNYVFFRYRCPHELAKGLPSFCFCSPSIARRSIAHRSLSFPETFTCFSPNIIAIHFRKRCGVLTPGLLYPICPSIHSPLPSGYKACAKKREPGAVG